MENTEPLTRSPLGGSNATYSVKFTLPQQSSWSRSKFDTSWRWVGAATLTLAPAELVIQGRRNRLFMLSAKQEARIAWSDIINVSVTDKAVRCEVRAEQGLNRLLTFTAATAEIAQDIASRLPRTKTEAFARSQADQSAFAVMLASVGTRAVVTPALVAANLLVFAITVFGGAGLMQPHGDVLVRFGSNFGPLTLTGEWWRVFTAMFLHFGLAHIVFNMLALYVNGLLVERLFGSVAFLLLYIVSGLSGSIASLFWHPNINSAGASGAIFGVIGALLAFMVNPKTRLPASVVTAQRNSTLVFIAYNLANGAAHAGIDNAAHLGGLGAGFILGWLLARPLDLEERRDPFALWTMGIGVSAVLLVGLSWPLTHPSPMERANRQFRADIRWVSEQENQALAAQHDLQVALNNEKITATDMAHRTDKEIVPRWRAMEDRLGDSPLPNNSTLAPVKTALLKYVDSRRLALELTDEAIIQRDPGKREWADDVRRDSEANAKAAGALMQQMH